MIRLSLWILEEESTEVMCLLNTSRQEVQDSGTSLAVQWLRLCASNAKGVGSIPGWGTKIPHAIWRGQENIKKKKRGTGF